MARLQPRGLLGIMILLLVLRRGETSDDLRSTCSAPQKVSVGESATIKFSLSGDFGNEQIGVFKRNARRYEMIADCYFKDGKRECEEEEGYSFNLTSDKEHTRGVLVILKVAEQCEGEYVCQILDLSSISSSCNLQVSSENAEVNTPPVSREGGYVGDKEVNTTQHRTDADRTSGLPPGAIAGIVIVIVMGVAVVAVMVFRMHIRTSCKKRGPEPYLPTTIKDGVASSEEKPCILYTADNNGVIPPTTVQYIISNDSSQGTTTPLIKTRV